MQERRGWSFENGDRLDILVSWSRIRGEFGSPYRVRRMPTDIARYSTELFKLGGEGAGIEEILDRHADLKIERASPDLKNKKRDTSWNILPCEYSKARPDCRTVREVSMTNLEPLEPHKDRRAGLRADPETS